MVRRAEILAGVIDLEPVDTGRRPERVTPTIRPRQVTVVMSAVLAVVLVAGSLAGRRGPDRPHHRLHFDEPPPASALFDPLVGEPTAGAGESAAAIGALAPVRPPHRIPEGWTWQPVGPLPGRQGNVAVWTGREIVYWGGDRPGRPAQGAAYDPRTQEWRRLRRSPLSNRTDPAAVWTGREVLVFGGVNGAGPQNDGAAYDPALDQWRAISASPLVARVPLVWAWTGTEVLVVARAVGFSDGIMDAAAYDPAQDTWRPLPTLPLQLAERPAPPTQINNGASVWTGRELIVYGRFVDPRTGAPLPDDRARGAALDPATGQWRDLAAAPLSGQAMALVWDGTEAIGWDHDLHSAALDPGRNTWRALPDLPLEARDCLPVGVAAGAAVFAVHCGQGALFDRRRPAWAALPVPGSAVDPPVWTGDGLVEWLGPSGRPDDGTWFRPMTP
jgi:hypothetical protein